MSHDSFRNKVILAVLAVAVVVFVLATSFAVKSSLSTPEKSYLSAPVNGRWIKLDQPFRLNARSNGSEMALFRRFFELAGNTKIRLHLNAFRGTGVWLDGVPLLKFDGDMSKWRDEILLDFPELGPGRHELKIAVVNENAHPALSVWAEEADIATPEGWEGSKDDFVWNPVADAAKTGKLFIGNKFKRADEALLGGLPYMLPLFLLTAGAVWMREKQKIPAALRRYELTPEIVRFGLLGLWAVMALNNFHDLPLKLGMDSTGHFKYIEYVGENLRLPSPVEGWQMFQPPLYYIISALFYKFLLLFTDIENTLYWLRLIPLACGGLMIEISFRCARLIFREDRLAQIAATILGGFMPMNFVMSQFWGNEPFAAVFSALTIFMTLSIINREDGRRFKDYIFLGLFSGCAVLSKATASLLLPPSVFFILLAVHDRGRTKTAGEPIPVVGISVSVLVTATVGGWYYLKNWLAYGKPFIGGWDKIREIGWWQDHGYRIWEHFTEFGGAVLKPVYSTVDGIWDGLYSTLWLDGNLSGVSKFASRPPWNDDLMMATSLLAIIPSLLILAGIARTFYTPLKSVFNGRMFLVGCVAVYFTAVTYLYLNLPIYSTAKASYTLGLLPCYGILAAAGIKPALSNCYVKAAFCGFLAVWGSTVYLTYFV
ncbi:ArnT family glycosyltransferase [Maridesulfovibrio sp. FT414]|uniref:ArnT family glycosyltransferase n=1 Tax=Maridesulfovibrio sp. FT414 TaxID=2979469 RepID=UPI003D808289